MKGADADFLDAIREAPFEGVGIRLICEARKELLPILSISRVFMTKSELQERAVDHAPRVCVSEHKKKLW
jgi:hypothetical protein